MTPEQAIFLFFSFFPYSPRECGVGNRRFPLPSASRLTPHCSSALLRSPLIPPR